jgi:uncharacterized protein (DUF2252 family)
MTATARRTGPAGVEHLSVDERIARGRLARREVPRARHAEYDAARDRADPVRLLEEQGTTRVPELVPIRYGRMLVSPFTFYRGAAKIMAHDLAGTPQSGLVVQCCGDAHLSNFGLFASPERRLVFDINDFDETLPGPWEWDVKRLAVSMLIAARDNGFNAKDQDRIVRVTVREYRQAMRKFAGMGNLAVWYEHMEVEPLLAQYAPRIRRSQLKRAEHLLATARTRDSLSAFSKLTRRVGDGAEIVDLSPLVVPVRALAEGLDRDAILDELRGLVRAYRASLDYERRVLLDQFRAIDFARKVVGVGSVGTRAWIALLFGRDGSDPLFMQVKEAEASVLEEHVGKSRFSNHGQRVVVGQRLMQANGDIFLGWIRTKSTLDGVERDFYGRQLKDWKGSVEIDQMLPDGMALYGGFCGWTLARAHARSGDRIALAAYLGGGDSFDRAILEFSKLYADQNERDFASLVGAVNDGRIVVQTGL